MNYSLRDRFKTQQGHKQQSPGEGQQAFRPEPQAPASNAPTLDHNLGAEDRCEEPDLPKETAKTIQARYDGLKKPRCSVAHWGIWRQTNPTPHKRFVPNLRTHKVTLDDKSFQLDRLFSHDATPGDIFAELEPWVLHLSSKLAEGKYHCLVLLAFGFSGLGKTRVMTGEAAGSAFKLDTSVIGCTSELLFKNKPRDVGVVGRLIEICTGEKNEIVVCTLEKGIATVAKLDSKWKEGRFRRVLPHTKLGTHKDAMNFVQRCVKARPSRKTPRNPSGSSRSHQLIFFDFVATGKNGELLLDKDEDLFGTVMFSDLAGYENGEVETANINAELGSVVDNCFPYLGQKMFAPGHYFTSGARVGYLSSYYSHMYARGSSDWIIFSFLGEDDHMAADNKNTLDRAHKVCAPFLHSRSSLHRVLSCSLGLSIRSRPVALVKPTVEHVLKVPGQVHFRKRRPMEYSWIDTVTSDGKAHGLATVG